MKGEWFVVVNPIAGNGKGLKDWQHISILLDKAGLQHINVITEHKGQAITLVRRYIEMGFSRIIVVGGDGTLMFRMEADGEAIPPAVYDIQILEKAFSVVVP